MNILIITTFFPPDSAIAAVRPYMFAKYLTKLGHQVTVLRSGELARAASDFFATDLPIRVISYLGEDSPAERYARGEQLQTYSGDKSRISFLPPAIRFPLAKLYHTCMGPLESLRTKRHAKARFALQQAALDSLRGEHFDVVFSTFGRLENVYAGQYAAKLFGCKLVQDFRDPIARQFLQTPLEYKIYKRLQDRVVAQADACTAVSDGLVKGLSSSGACGEKIVTLYNGYEPAPAAADSEAEPDQGILSICFTGQIYAGFHSFLPMVEALQSLHQKGSIRLDRVRIDYAGPNAELLRAELASLHMEHILADHGYVTRDEAARLQQKSDIFTVLSWNTVLEQGAISGKFYEGIRAKRPILALVGGDLPNSELYELNERYHYGFCYESCRREEQFPQLCGFLLRAYTQKMEHGHVDYAPAPELATSFRYDTLARQLESVFQKLTED